MLLERGRVIDEIRFPEADGYYSPAHDRSPQASRYCFDFRKFWHEGIRNKITHPLAATQGADANPVRSAAGRALRRSLLLIVRISRRPWNHNRMCLQRFQSDLNGAFELRIVARRDRRGLILDFDVRRNSVIFHFVLAVHAKDRDARRSNKTAI